MSNSCPLSLGLSYSGKRDMKKGAVMAAVLLVVGLAWLGRSRAAPLKPGDKAPDFALPDQSGATIRLSDFSVKKTVVLAFYIKSFTPG